MIFLLDSDPSQAAEWLLSTHLLSIGSEVAQLLGGVMRALTDEVRVYNLERRMVGNTVFLTEEAISEVEQTIPRDARGANHLIQWAAFNQENWLWLTLFSAQLLTQQRSLLGRVDPRLWNTLRCVERGFQPVQAGCGFAQKTPFPVDEVADEFKRFKPEEPFWAYRLAYWHKFRFSIVPRSHKPWWWLAWDKNGCSFLSSNDADR